MKFTTFIKKHNIPVRTAYNWKEAFLPVIQVGRVCMIRESEGLAALERFKRHVPTLRPINLKKREAALTK
jgi:hypothetical protein